MWVPRLLVLNAFLLIALIYSLLYRPVTTPAAPSRASPSTILRHSSPDHSTYPSIEAFLSLPAPPNLPSVRLTPEEEAQLAKKRGIYGGVGDKLHLGGFTEIDPMGISNNTFNFMLGPLAIKSVIDVGCGKGISTEYFSRGGARVLCVEGSHDAVMQSRLPSNLVVEHDFTRGPWWPTDTFDAVWCVEFLEHVGRPYMKNYLPIFHKSALLFVTSSAWGGWHHVEVHAKWWWKARLTAQGFVYSQDLTDMVSRSANIGRSAPGTSESQHIIHGMMVFINPAVARLEKHAHLFGGFGCFNGVIHNDDGGKDCDEREDKLPGKYRSVLSCTTEDINKVPYVCHRDPQAIVS